MAKYFENINALEALRKQYKELPKTYHPDNGGNVRQMQEINAEYDQIIGFHDITIEIVGAWIWLSENTYSYKKN